jgi:hypothetical protein
MDHRNTETYGVGSSAAEFSERRCRASEDVKNIHDTGAGIKYLKRKSKDESFYDGGLN